MNIFLIASEKLIYLLDLSASRDARKGQKSLFQVQVFQIYLSQTTAFIPSPICLIVKSSPICNLV